MKPNNVYEAVLYGSPSSKRSAKYSARCLSVLAALLRVSRLARQYRSNSATAELYFKKVGSLTLRARSCLCLGSLCRNKAADGPGCWLEDFAQLRFVFLRFSGGVLTIDDEAVRLLGLLAKSESVKIPLVRSLCRFAQAVVPVEAQFQFRFPLSIQNGMRWAPPSDCGAKRLGPNFDKLHWVFACPLCLWNGQFLSLHKADGGAPQNLFVLPVSTLSPYIR